MRIKFLNKEYLPTKEVIYHFLSNFILLFITLFVGNFYINGKLQEISRYKVEQQELVNEKNNFVKNFTKLGQGRIYQAENYIKNYNAGEDEKVLRRSWENYMQTVKEWNQENLLNPIFIKLYFGNDMRDEFHNNLLLKLVLLHESILKIRDGEEVIEIDQVVENAKNELFNFSERMIFN